jgi:dUTP pyrophosphatase
LKKKLKIPVQRMGRHHLPLPAYATVDSSGLDLRAHLKKPVLIKAGEFKMIPTGFALGLPPGYEAQVRPRSGLAARCGLTVLNSPGTIDADYRGEIQVILINHSHKNFLINPGERIAQLVIQPVPRVTLVEKTNLPRTSRGPAGFGHTGT